LLAGLNLVASSNSLRIIGGIWRSRRIQFIDSPKIRTTPDRVRETAFNWLAADIDDADCLDLFAGSGALGFEAKSRGADHVVLIEKDSRIAATLNQQKELLDAQNLEIRNQNALEYLRSTEQQFDVIFLDPPFDSDLLEKVLPVILERKILVIKGLLYVETASQLELPQPLKALNCIREKVSGEVRHALYENDTNQQE